MGTTWKTIQPSLLRSLSLSAMPSVSTSRCRYSNLGRPPGPAGPGPRNWAKTTAAELAATTRAATRPRPENRRPRSENPIAITSHLKERLSSVNHSGPPAIPSGSPGGPDDAFFGTGPGPDQLG